MKRILTLFFVLIMALTLVMCGKGKDSGDKDEAKDKGKQEAKLSEEAKVFLGKWKAVNKEYPDKPAEWTFKESGEVITKGMGMTIPGKFNVTDGKLNMVMPQGKVAYTFTKDGDKFQLEGEAMGQKVQMTLTKIQ